MLQKLLDSEFALRVITFAFEYRRRFFVGLICLLIVYLFVCLLSYSSLDPSWSHLSTQARQITNIGGAGGAWISDILYLFTGYGAWAVLVWLSYEAFCAYQENICPIMPIRLLAYVFMWVSLCVLLAVMGDKGGVIGYEFYTALLALMGHMATMAFAVIGLLLIGYLLLDNDKMFIKKQSATPNTAQPQPPTSPKPQSTAPKPTIQPITPNPNHAINRPTPTAGALKKDRLHTFLNESGLKADMQQQMEQDHLNTPDDTGVSDSRIAGRPTTVMGNADTNDAAHFLNTPPSVGGQIANNEANDSQYKVNEPSSYDDSMQDGDYQNSHIRQNLSNFSYSHNNTPIGDEAKEVFSGINLDGLSAFDVSSDESSATATDDDDKAADKIPTKSATTNQTATDKIVADKIVADKIPIDEMPTDSVVMGGIDVANERPPQSTQTNQASTATDATIFDGIGVFATADEAVVPSHAQDHLSEQPSKNQPNNPPTPPKPDIHDDTVYKTQSYAMQMASYRKSLSPLPSIELLDPKPLQTVGYSPIQLNQLSELLEIKLKEFNVTAKVMNVIQGPIVTSFEVELAAGIKASKVTGISQDLARSLSMASLRVVEVIAGKPYIGIEIPNKSKQTVKLVELLSSLDYQDSSTDIAMAMGKDIGGRVVITDLARAPHMLVAGTTGSGKSVLVNAMLLSMLLKYTPDELRLILIDPKMLELANYGDIPHLLTPVVTDMTEAASALSWCVGEMERRYQLMSFLKVRKIAEFNKKVNEATQEGKSLLDPLWRPNDSVSQNAPPKLKTLPLIVVVADEFADMMMQVGRQAEELITRLAQKSRAAGIHLVLATQRPSVDVITGLIKANIPSRAALRVNSRVDSRTILDSGGAEDMLGHGDMLFLAPGKNEPIRVHGAYVTDAEVNRICDAWRERGAPDYIDTVVTSSDYLESPKADTGADALYDEALAFIIDSGKTSISALQRKLSIGYNRAANIIESMEQDGVLSAPDNSGKRTLLL